MFLRWQHYKREEDRMDGQLVVRSFGREAIRSFPEGIRREWVITNGIGGYAGSSVIGANTRKHHGLLIAALHAPTDRKVLLNRIDEKAVFHNRTVSFSSVQRKKHYYENGWENQTEFCYDAVPTFSYFMEGLFVRKTVSMEWEKNTTAILYEMKNEGEDAIIELSPSFVYRDHNDGAGKRDHKWKVSCQKDTITLVPNQNKNIKIRLFASCGDFVLSNREELYDENIELQTEIDTGMSSKDTGYIPYHIELSLKAGEQKDVSIICTIENSYERDAKVTIKNARERAKELILQGGDKDSLYNSLVMAADKFITKRASTNGKTILAGLPWFTDWGRDTMISFTGLTLVTKRFEDAKSILKTFAQYEKEGLIPNMFPDSDTDPLYNTVDASLWYFYCVDQYLRYVDTKEAKDFIRNEIYPCLKKIQTAYENGTKFSIYMDTDGLIHAGSDLDQVTWMDVRVKDWVVTPRHGKPVEINALWYNAVKVMEKLSDEYNEPEYSKHLQELAARISKSFSDKFWNEQAGCLYDVVEELRPGEEEAKNNAQIRPNQVWAVSLPYTMLDEDKENSIVSVLLQKLYVGVGMRTLPVEDPNYHGVYVGALHDRDAAYHQGTAWAFPLGGFIDAYVKVNKNTEEARMRARDLLIPIMHHLNDGCIGGIAEIFDADAPHISRGCYTQAWSVGEILRAYSNII